MSASRKRTAIVAASVLATLSLGVAACGDSNDSSSAGSGDSSGKSGKIALLLPENKTARYEAQDRPLFTNKLKELCSGCEVLYSNAGEDADKQLSQADAALTNGAKVLVLDPVNAESAASIVNKAKAQNVPVVSYDRLVSKSDVDFYISFDNETIGKQQGQALVDKLTKDGTIGKGKIVMLNGNIADPNAAFFKRGAHSAIDGKVPVGVEFDVKDWSAAEAQKNMDQAITELGKSNIVGVYAANDPLGGAAIAAMKGAGFNPLGVVTGQDAELAGIQRIVAGEQYMTIYKAIKPEAEQAAQAAVDLLNGRTPASSTKMNNGKKDVPSTLLTSIVVTKDNVKDTVVKDGFQTVQQICTPAYQKACQDLGLM